MRKTKPRSKYGGIRII